MTSCDPPLRGRLAVLLMAVSLAALAPAAPGVAAAQDAEARGAPDGARPSWRGVATVVPVPSAPPVGETGTDSVARTRKEPGLFRRADLVPAAAFTGALALAGTAPELDRSVRADAYHDGGGPDHALYRAGDLAGDVWVDLGASGAAWLVGSLVGSEPAARAGRRALEATVASTAVVAVMKMGFGRARPSLSGDPRDFRPGTLDRERYSFPSGHTAHAFAIAAALDHELEGAWVPWVAYPLATGVGASRVVGRRHWVSDVVAGAAVGVVTSRLLDRLHGDAEPAAGGGVEPRMGVGPSGAAYLGLRVPLPR